VVQSLGYKVGDDGTIFREDNENGKATWLPFSQLGARKAILSDLSPIASFIAYTYNTPFELHRFQSEAKDILQKIESKYGWLFQTLHTPSPEQINSAKSLIVSDDSPDLSQTCLTGCDSN